MCATTLQDRMEPKTKHAPQQSIAHYKSEVDIQPTNVQETESSCYRKCWQKFAMHAPTKLRTEK